MNFRDCGWLLGGFPLKLGIFVCILGYLTMDGLDSFEGWTPKPLNTSVVAASAFVHTVYHTIQLHFLFFPHSTVENCANDLI